MRPGENRPAFVPDDLLRIQEADPQQAVQNLAGEFRGVPDVSDLEAGHQGEGLRPVGAGVAGDRGVRCGPRSGASCSWLRLARSHSGRRGRAIRNPARSRKAGPSPSGAASRRRAASPRHRPACNPRRRAGASPSPTRRRPSRPDSPVPAGRRWRGRRRRDRRGSRRFRGRRNRSGSDRSPGPSGLQAPARAMFSSHAAQLTERFTISRNAFTCASVHSSHRITGTSVMPSFFAAFSRRWPSTTSPLLRASTGILKPYSRMDAPMRSTAASFLRDSWRRKRAYESTSTRCAALRLLKACFSFWRRSFEGCALRWPNEQVGLDYLYSIATFLYSGEPIAWSSAGFHNPVKNSAPSQQSKPTPIAISGRRRLLDTVILGSAGFALLLADGSI